MYPELYGYQHIIYLVVFFAISISSLILIKKYVKSEKTINIILKALGGALLFSILLNRFSIFTLNQTHTILNFYYQIPIVD